MPLPMDYTLKVVLDFASESEKAGLSHQSGPHRQREHALEVRVEYTVEDLKELIDFDITRGSLPICRMWLEIAGHRDILALQRSPDTPLWEFPSLKEGATVVVKAEKQTHPPNGGLMWNRDLLRSPTACRREEKAQLVSPDMNVPVVRCRPFTVDSLAATPFVVELDSDAIRDQNIPYAEAYIYDSHISIVEFEQAPRFDSRFGLRAGSPDGSWKEVFSAKVHEPDQPSRGILAFPVVPPDGWTNGGFYHVVLVAGGPFDELRGVCFAFKVRLKTFRKAQQARPFLLPTVFDPRHGPQTHTKPPEESLEKASKAPVSRTVSLRRTNTATTTVGDDLRDDDLDDDLDDSGELSGGVDPTQSHSELSSHAVSGSSVDLQQQQEEEDDATSGHRTPTKVTKRRKKSQSPPPATSSAGRRRSKSPPPKGASSPGGSSSAIS